MHLTVWQLYLWVSPGKNPQVHTWLSTLGRNSKNVQYRLYLIREEIHPKCPLIGEEIKCSVFTQRDTIKPVKATAWFVDKFKKWSRKNDGQNTLPLTQDVRGPPSSLFMHMQICSREQWAMLSITRIALRSINWGSSGWVVSASREGGFLVMDMVWAQGQGTGECEMAQVLTHETGGGELSYFGCRLSYE